jgi:hypothetical protein
MSTKNLALINAAILLALAAPWTGALAHAGPHLPGMTHPHVEVHHLLLGALAALAVGLALRRSRRGGDRP